MSVTVPRRRREFEARHPNYEWKPSTNGCVNCGPGGSCIYCTCFVCSSGRDVYCPTHPPDVDHVAVHMMAIHNYLSRDFADVTKSVLRTPRDYRRLLTDEGKAPPFVVASGFWSDLQPHAAVWLVKLGMPRRPRVIKDAELVVARFNRADDAPSFLDVYREPGAMIIRLGFMSAKNSELGAVIYEAVRLRQSEKLPTLLVIDPIEPWKKSHRAYTPEIDAFLKQSFTPVSITPRAI